MNADSPAVSVVVPLHNGAAWIDQTLDAVRDPVPAASVPGTFTQNRNNFSLGERLSIPAKHGEGRYYAPDELLDEMEAGGQVAEQLRPVRVAEVPAEADEHQVLVGDHVEVLAVLAPGEERRRALWTHQKNPYPGAGREPSSVRTTVGPWAQSRGTS